MEWLLIAAVIGGVAFGISRGIAAKPRENAFNQQLKQNLEHRQRELEDWAKQWKQYLEARDQAFRKGFVSGRRWLADLIAEAERARDRRDAWLAGKSHPARKAAAIVREVKNEKRELAVRLKFLEYQLKSYEEYFPQLEEYRELILDERVPLSADADNLAELEATDPTERYLTREEWSALPTAARNQLALDRYIAREKSNWEIGRFYERYLGYLREKAGWKVTYHGALEGFADLGRDLICAKDGHTEIVQAKCWSKTKTIHEKHLFQLFGTTIHFRLDHPGTEITPIFATTTALSEVAQMVAAALEVRVETVPLPKTYPMIKCNINPTTGERIYHLPFDQQYDRTEICRPGERYVANAEEAEQLGFRRAWRHRFAESN